MGRGSICSWQDYARRSSTNVPQFSSSRTEFMTSDEIEYKRGDGWFLSYPKIAAVIIVFIIGVSSAGFLGWYVNSLPKKKTYDAFALMNDGFGDVEVVGRTSISPFIRPLKYRLELTPVIDANCVSKMKGRVVIEFRVDGTPRLSKLSLNAKNITATGHKLSQLDQPEVKARLKRRRSSSIMDQANDENHGEPALPVQLEDRNFMRENDTANAEESTRIHDHSFSNDTFQMRSANLSDTEESFVTTAPVVSQTISKEIGITQYQVREDVHVVHLATHIGQGNYSLEIDYEILVDSNIFYMTDCKLSSNEKYSSIYSSNGVFDKSWMLGTKLRPFRARHLFPVFDDVREKSVFSVSVARPRETRVLSNMPLRVSRDTSENWTIDTFDDSPLLSPNNLAFMMGYIEAINETLIGDTKVRASFGGVSQRDSQGTYLLRKLEPTVINLIDLFSLQYPFPKLDVVDMPSGSDENVGNPGLISTKQSLFRITDESPLIEKEDALKSLIYLIGRQWLGGFVNMNWTDAWILEGSLLHLQYELIQKIDSSLNSSDSFVSEVQADIMEIDGYSVSSPLKSNINHLGLYSGDQYRKGACLIRMLHRAINDTTFRNGYKKFIMRWQYGIADAAEFFSAMGNETNGLPSEITLQEIMNPWISKSGYPVVTVTRNYENGSAFVRQEHFTHDKLLAQSDKRWYIPLTYISEDGNWASPSVTWFSPKTEMHISQIGDKRSWVIFNVNKTGYYRVRYDDENWRLLMIELKENHEDIPPETRASLIDDIFSLAAVGLARYETALNFIKYMQMKERHYAPWRVLMHHVFRLNNLLYETPAFTDFQEFMLKLISPLYQEVGSKLEEGSQLTLIATEMACVFEHSECLDWSRNTSAKIMADFESRETIPPYIRKTLYCTIARYGTRKEWHYFIENATTIVDKEERKRFLSAYGCFQAPWIHQSIFEEVLHGNRFDEDEISSILGTFSRNPAAADAASKFVRANWQAIVKRFSGSYTVLQSFVYSMVNGFTIEQDLEDLRTFRADNYERMKGARHTAAIVEANANFVITWLKNSLPEVERLLKKEVVNTVSL